MSTQSKPLWAPPVGCRSGLRPNFMTTIIIIYYNHNKLYEMNIIYNIIILCSPRWFQLSVCTYLILLLFYTWKQFRFGTVFIEIGAMKKYSKRISNMMTYYYNIFDRLRWIIKRLKKLNFNKRKEKILYLYQGQSQVIIFNKISIFILLIVIIIKSHILSAHCSFDEIYVPLFYHSFK